MDPSVSALAYIGLEVADMGAWKHFLARVFGMSSIDAGEGRALVRMDDRNFRLSLHSASENRHVYTGWEVASDAALDTLVDRLRDEGIEVTEEQPEICALRCVRRMVSLNDPTLGVRFELVIGPGRSAAPFMPARPISGYKTGGLGLGHAVFTASDPRAAAAAMVARYGFRVSDYCSWDGIDMAFLHCNQRHHSLAFISPLGPSGHGALQHIMVEATDFVDVGRAYDIVEQDNWPLVMTMGSHPNDDSTSFYVRTPSGFAMEYSWGGRDIDGDWTVVTHDAPHTWGHRLQIQG